MAGGDLNIRGVVGFNSPGVEAAKIGRIDANSTKGGDFTEQRQVGGKDVWLTPAGARALDEAQAKGGDGTVFDMKVEKDAGWLSQWFWGTKERPDTIGKP
jgi:hypothetical protein